VDEVAVVIPVNDEEELLERCLAAVHDALGHLDDLEGPARVRVILVLDACTDGSAGIAARWPLVETLVLSKRRVGAARAHGVRHAIDSSGVPASRLWIANTDADSRVPSHWIAHQLDLARTGVDVMLGAIRPEPRDLTPHQFREWQLRHLAAAPTAHVHGANLGVRAAAYLEAGGFPDVREHEDVTLVEQLRRVGAIIQSTDACWVQTSARTTGRTPGGYAAHVRAFY